MTDHLQAESYTPLFTVIVPTHNRPRLLSSALGSVLAQTVQDFECIVVDDSSTEPLEIPEDPRIRIVRQPVNVGHARCLNTGLDHARGRYITWLDDDDLFTPERLQLGWDGMAKGPIAICWRADPATGVAGRNRMLGKDAHDVILDRPIPMMGQTTMIREEVPYFDTELRASIDLEWWIRATKNNPVVTIPRVGLYLRRHSGPRVSSNLRVRLRSREYVWTKHRVYFDAHPRAAARFLRRMGVMALRTNDYARARPLLWKAFKLRPQPKTLTALLAALRPQGISSVPVPPRAPDTSR